MNPSGQLHPHLMSLVSDMDCDNDGGLLFTAGLELPPPEGGARMLPHEVAQPLL